MLDSFKLLHNFFPVTLERIVPKTSVSLNTTTIFILPGYAEATRLKEWPPIDALLLIGGPVHMVVGSTTGDYWAFKAYHPTDNSLVVYGYLPDAIVVEARAAQTEQPAETPPAAKSAAPPKSKLHAFGDFALGAVALATIHYGL